MAIRQAWAGVVLLLLSTVSGVLQADPTPRGKVSDSAADDEKLLAALQAQMQGRRPAVARRVDEALSQLASAPERALVPKALRYPAEEDPDAPELDARGLVQVHVRLSDSASPAMLSQLEAEGLKLELLSGSRRIVQGWISPNAVDRISQLPGVQRLSRPPYGTAQKQGIAATAGDVALRFNRVRDSGLTGRGIRVGVIADGVESIASSQASSDLGQVVVLSGCSSGDDDDGVCDEGTAMLEIVHDIAPDAVLGFCGGKPGARGTSNLDFISCAERLAGPEFNADIIVDDLLYASEPMLEDGGSDSIASAVEAITDRGVIWVSAGGNNGSGPSNRQFYSSDFFPLLTSSPAVGQLYDALNDFAFAATRNRPLAEQLHGARNPLKIEPGKVVRLVLQWDDPFDGSALTDYDLFVFEKGTSQILDSSTDRQDGNGNDDYPVETLNYVNATSETVEVDIVIARRAGSGVRRMKMFTCFQDSAACDLFYANNRGQVIGHPALHSVVTVGAIDVRDPGLDTIEDYSSTGPAVLTLPIYTERSKPDVVATDRVDVTGAGGFPDIFGGTSAAAPHVAALLALLREGYPSKDAEQAILGSAVDLGEPGRDYVFGYGRIDGILAANAAFAQVPDGGTGSGSGTPPPDPVPSEEGDDAGGAIAGDLLILLGLAGGLRVARQLGRQRKDRAAHIRAGRP